MPTLDGNGKFAMAFLANLLEEIGGLRIVAVFSCPTEQTFDFPTVAHGTTIEKRDSKMILSFLAAVHRRVVGPDGRSVGPDGGGRIPASSNAVLKTVTDLKPGGTILRASRTSPPLKGSPEVAQFAVYSGDVVRCGCVPEAKLVPQLTNRDSMSVQITHELGLDSVSSADDRDKYDHFALRSLLQSLGISLRSATEPIDDTSTGKLMEGVLAPLRRRPG